MATFSNVLGLKLNAASDPFQLSDFIGNWDILDASPGVFICTSNSRPTWGTAQAGRMIFQTDLKQISFWDGTTWRDLRDAAPVFAGGVFVNQSINPGATPSYNIVTFTTPRPCSMAIIMTGSYGFPDNKFQDATQSATFDGVASFMGGYQDQIRLPGDKDASGSLAGATLTTLQVVTGVTAGQHKIGAKVTVGSQYKTAIVVNGFKVIGLIALYTSGNAL